jgi:hypothetical protein
MRLSSLDVVDGNGIEVASEPVTASFAIGDAGREVVAVTDRAGRARFVIEHATVPHNVTMSAGRESVGPIHPVPGRIVVIEI